MSITPEKGIVYNIKSLFIGVSHKSTQNEYFVAWMLICYKTTTNSLLRALPTAFSQNIISTKIVLINLKN